MDTVTLIIFVFTLTFGIVFRCTGADDGDVVQLNHGRVMGTTLKSRNGRGFKAFFGIPYAKPPVGDLRFKVKSFYRLSIINNRHAYRRKTDYKMIVILGPSARGSVGRRHKTHSRGAKRRMHSEKFVLLSNGRRTARRGGLFVLECVHAEGNGADSDVGKFPSVLAVKPVNCFVVTGETGRQTTAGHGLDRGRRFFRVGRHRHRVRTTLFDGQGRRRRFVQLQARYPG